MHTISLSQLNRYCWTKQLLTPQAWVRTVAMASDRVVGLHAARLSSPYVAAACRVVDFEPPLLRRAWLDRRELVKLRCMRGTLHLLSHDHAHHAHLATLRGRESICRRILAVLGMEAREIGRLRERIVAQLEAGPASPRDVERRLADRGVPLERSRAVLKLLWEQGKVTLLDNARSWQSEQRLFALTAQAYPRLCLAGDEGQARTQLIGLYFRAFGPASIADAVWWTGLGRRAVTNAMAETHVRLVPVCVSHRSSKDELFMAEEDVDELHRCDSSGEPWVQLLAHEEPSLKAYYGSRWRYVGRADSQQLFNTIGEARASIMVDGRYAGLWQWHRRERRIELTVTAPVRKHHRRDLAARAELLTEILRAEPPRASADAR